MNRTREIAQMIDKRFNSQSEFARTAGIPLTTLRSILEKGIDGASVSNAIKICNALNIEVEYLNPQNETEPIKQTDEFTESEKQIIYAYRIASGEAQDVVKNTLARYMHEEYADDKSEVC